MVTYPKHNIHKIKQLVIQKILKLTNKHINITYNNLNNKTIK